MGKAKSKAKKTFEENEFLNDLIEEVKLQDGTDDEVTYDSLSSQFNVLAPSENQKMVNVLISEGTSVESNHDSTEEENLATVFEHVKKDIKAPKLKPTSNQQNEQTVPSIDAQPHVVQEQAGQVTATAATNGESDRTIAVEGARGNRPILQEKVATGSLKGTRNGQVYTSLDASLAQAETLKIAQARIKELELEADRLRMENDDLASAGDVVTRRVEDLQIRLHRLEKEKSDLKDQSKNELLILKGNLQFKEKELSKTKAKLEDLDMRIKSDFRKIRVRERELENRLELVRGEKQALVRNKDEKILDLQRKLDQYKSEIDLYRAKVHDLNKIMESQHDQMQKTIRALRIALVNLEHEDNEGSEGNEDKHDLQAENFSENDSKEQKKAR